MPIKTKRQEGMSEIGRGAKDVFAFWKGESLFFKLASQPPA
jgi:hypothetical protein